MLRPFRIDIAYDGTEFFGSQRQAVRRTVQGELERALQRIAPGSGSTAFAGRTDAGVHARGQVVSGHLAWRADGDALRHALNSVLPTDIAVSAANSADESFHARYDARWREYRYALHIGPTPDVFVGRYAWWRRRDPDASLVQRVLGELVGEHAFGTFAGAGRSQHEPPESLVRRVRLATWAVDGDMRSLRIIANGFLPHMVRNIVGAVVLVADGDATLDWFIDAFQRGDRRCIGQAAPPQGLVLQHVYYDDLGAEP